MHAALNRPWQGLLRLVGPDDAPANRAVDSDRQRPAGLGKLDSAQALLHRVEWQIVRPLDGLLQGDYRSLFLGQGLDLADIREYQPGDDVRSMEWNVTARTGTPHVRQYQEDREISAWLLLDISASIRFGTARTQKYELLTDFAAVTARLLTRRGNRVGAMLFSGGVDAMLPARGGRQQVLSLVHLLQSEKARKERRPASTDLSQALHAAAQTIRRRSLVIVVSDFVAPSGWEIPLRRLAQRHELLAVRLSDPRERELPDIGRVVLEDAESGAQIDVDTHDRGFRSRFRDLVEAQSRRLTQAFAAAGADVIELSTDREMAGDLVQFAHRRRALPQRKRPRLGVGGPGGLNQIGVGTEKTGIQA